MWFHKVCLPSPSLDRTKVLTHPPGRQTRYAPITSATLHWLRSIKPNSKQQLGRPLNFHFYGSMDTHKLYSKMTPERHWETFMVNAELLTREILPAASRQAGKHVGTVFVVVDLKGFRCVHCPSWRM